MANKDDLDVEIVEEARSRRHMLKLAGGVVAGGAAVALATASPAAAETDDPLKLGWGLNQTLNTTAAWYYGVNTDAAFTFGHVVAGGVAGGPELGPDIKAGGTGRISQVSSLGEVNSQPSFGVNVSPHLGGGPAHELVRSQAGLLWASTGTGTGANTLWKRMNTVRTDRATGTGVALTPQRIVDTRTTSAMIFGTTRTFSPLPTAYAAGISPESVALMGNLTITSPSAGGYATIYPAGVAEPATSSINFAAGQTVANFFCVGLGTGVQAGKFTVIARKSGGSGGSLQVIVDVTAYIQ